MKSVIYSLTIVLSCVLLGCGSGGEETVSYNDISPNSKPRNRKDLPKDTIASEKPKQSVYLSLMDSIRPDDSWKLWDTLLFPDRFGATKSEKWIVKNENDSIVLLYFKFRDSLMTKNAFFNWIDCFGPKCNSYTVGGNIKVKGKYTYFFVGHSDIYYLESSKAMKPETIRDQLLTKKGPNRLKAESWLYMVESKPKGKAVWKRVVKGEEKEIKNSYENIE